MHIFQYAYDNENYLENSNYIILNNRYKNEKINNFFLISEPTKEINYLNCFIFYRWRGRRFISSKWWLLFW